MVYNTIIGQPISAIDLNSVEHVDVTNNQIINSSRTPNVNGGIVIQNIGNGYRGSNNVYLVNNYFDNTLGTMPFGIGVGGCALGTCTESISNITIGSNTFVSFPTAFPHVCKKPPPPQIETSNLPEVLCP